MLPMVGVVFAAVWVGYANSIVWPLLVANDRLHMTAPLLLANSVGTGT